MLKRNLVQTVAVFLHIYPFGCCLQITAHKIRQIEPHYFRHHTENERALNIKKRSVKPNFKSKFRAFYRYKMQFFLHPAGETDPFSHSDTSESSGQSKACHYQC